MLIGCTFSSHKCCIFFKKKTTFDKLEYAWNNITEVWWWWWKKKKRILERKNINICNNSLSILLLATYLQRKDSESLNEKEDFILLNS